jgi:hypothetical protein
MNSKIAFRRLLLIVAIFFCFTSCRARKEKTENRLELTSVSKVNLKSDSSRVEAQIKVVNTSTTTKNGKKKYTRKTVIEFDPISHSPSKKTIEEEGEDTDTMKNNSNTNTDNGFVFSDSHFAKNTIDSSKINTANKKDLKVSGNRLAVIAICIVILGLLYAGYTVYKKISLKNIVKSVVIDKRLLA